MYNNQSKPYLKDISEYDEIVIRSCFFGSTKLYKYLYDSVTVKVEVNSTESTSRFKYVDGILCIIFPEKLYRSKSQEEIAKSIAMMTSHIFLRHATRIKMFKSSVTYDPTLRDIYDKILDYWCAKFVTSMVPDFQEGRSRGSINMEELSKYSTLESMLKNADLLINTNMEVGYAYDDHEWIWDESETNQVFSMDDDDQSSSSSSSQSQGEQEGEGGGNKQQEQQQQQQQEQQQQEQEQEEQEEGDGSQEGDRDNQEDRDEESREESDKETPAPTKKIEDLEERVQNGYLDLDLSTSEIKELITIFNQDSNIAGTQAGEFIKEMLKKKAKKKVKWEKVVKFTIRADEEDVELDAWNKEDRRLLFMSKDIMMPGREYDFKKTKIPIFLFMDTSGSCVHHADRFWRAALTMDPKKFDIRLFCFDTRVYETTLESRKLFGFGGTRFDIIEQEIQKIIQRDGIKYPKAVFVITDGWGNYVKPEKPDRWHVFLTAGEDMGCFPPETKSYKLQDFE